MTSHPRNRRGVSDMLKATGAEFSVRSPTAGAKPGSTAAAAADDPGWHTGPARQFVITLSGRSEVEVSGGVHVLTSPGHINLIEDTTERKVGQPHHRSSPVCRLTTQSTLWT